MIRKIHRRAAVAVAAVALTTLVLSSCTSAEKPAEPTTSATATEAPDMPDAVEIPATPVGEKAQWVIDVVNAEADTTAADWKAIVDTTVITDDLIDQVVAILNTNVRPAKPVVATGYQSGDNTAVVTLEGVIGDPFNMHLSVNDAGLLNGIYFGPAEEAPAAAGSIDEVKARLETLGVDISALVVRTNADGSTETIISKDADVVRPLGSAFKLWVLLALAEDVAAGKISWDDTLTITDQLKSLPSGVLQNEPAGTTVTVRDAAIGMISISDNTATDLIIAKLGRERVEQAIAEVVADPAATYPLLTTREMFQIMWGVDPATRAAWDSAPVEQRRAMLPAIDAMPLAIDINKIDHTAQWQNGPEWFATAEDMAKVHEALAAINDPAVTAALTKNPGIATAEWTNVAYKGGSNMGVLTGTWRATAPDGSTLTMVLLASSDDSDATAGAQTEMFSLASDVFRLVQP